MSVTINPLTWPRRAQLALAAGVALLCIVEYRRKTKKAKGLLPGKLGASSQAGAGAGATGSEGRQVSFRVPQHMMPQIQEWQRTQQAADVAQQRGDFKEAEAQVRRGLTILRTTVGEEHAAVGHSLQVLGMMCKEQGKFDDALGAYDQALLLKVKALGKDHPEVAELLAGMADILVHTGHHEEAQPLVDRALTVFTKAHGENHLSVASTLDLLATIKQSLGKVEEADQLSARALAIYRHNKALPQIVGTVIKQAMLYRITDKYDQAKKAYDDILAQIKEENIPITNLLHYTILYALCSLYYDFGKESEARALEAQLLELDVPAANTFTRFATTLNAYFAIQATQTTRPRIASAHLGLAINAPAGRKAVKDDNGELLLRLRLLDSTGANISGPTGVAITEHVFHLNGDKSFVELATSLAPVHKGNHILLVEIRDNKDAHKRLLGVHRQIAMSPIDLYTATDADIAALESA